MPPAKRQEREDNEERLFSGGKTANFEATEFELVLPAGGVEEPTSLSAAVRGARCMVLWCFSLLSHCCLTRVEVQRRGRGDSEDVHVRDGGPVDS